MRRFMAALAVAGFAMGASTPTFAQTTATKSGRILALFFSSPGNGSFRVTLDTPLTGCAGNFAYVNTTFGNYESLAVAPAAAWRLSAGTKPRAIRGAPAGTSR